MRALAYAGLVAAMFFHLDVQPALAEPADAAEAGSQKINVAGRQRMLTQRMSAAACLSIAASDFAASREKARQAIDAFDRALQGLRYGDAALRLTPEHHPMVLAALDAVEAEWLLLRPAIEQLAAGDAHAIAVRQMLRENVPLLKLSHAAVVEFTEVYGAGARDGAMAQTVNLAGRQRMLSQKMMKEACLIAANVDARTNEGLLAQTIAEFAGTLQDLQRGNAERGIAPPPNPEISAQLRVVEQLAGKYIAALRDVRIGDPQARRGLNDLADQSDDVLKAMHQAVLLYVQI